MATCFKLPSPTSKRKPPLQFPEFEWADVSIEEEVGSGTFRSMYVVKYKKEDRNVIMKKMKGESMETKRRFQEEAGLLSSVKGHRNVTRSDTSLGNMTFCHSHSAF